MTGPANRPEAATVSPPALFQREGELQSASAFVMVELPGDGVGAANQASGSNRSFALAELALARSIAAKSPAEPRRMQIPASLAALGHRPYGRGPNQPETSTNCP